MIVLTEAEVRRRLDPAMVIAAVESAFRDRFPSIIVPVRTQIKLTAGVSLFMPCYDESQHALGMKIVIVQDRPSQPEDRIQATYLLLDPETGRLTATIAAKYLTDVRTAATSAVATKLLAREDARVLGIFGTGRQAEVHAKLIPLVRPIERVLVCGRDSTRTVEFARRMAAELGIPVETADPPTCAAESDIICTCTNSLVPLFDGRLLRPGTHLNLIGAFQPHTREVDSMTIQRARVMVEARDAALAEAGDLLIPINEGLFGADHILADLRELLNGKKVVRESSADITVFKSLGNALEDLATAELLMAS